MAASLRLVTRNVGDSFRTKYRYLEPLRPDIAVLQAVRPSCLEHSGLRDDAMWTGMQGHEGLAVIGFNGWQVTAAPIPVHDKWFLPLWATKDSHCVNIVAVWVDAIYDCVPPILRALDQLRSFLGSGPTIMAGDFNQNVTLDARRGPGQRFSEVLDAFATRGMCSAWHQSTGERHGEETVSTHYWRGNPGSKFHIDFAFSSTQFRIQRATLGSYDEYVLSKISDHVPLVVDYALAPSQPEL